jgi:formiminotetrahydrofolate cyclodeaminase
LAAVAQPRSFEADAAIDRLHDRVILLAIELLNAGRRGAQLNVETNVESLKDRELVERIRRDVKRYAGENV